jgi:hypothetical protein
MDSTDKETESNMEETEFSSKMTSMTPSISSSHFSVAELKSRAKLKGKANANINKSKRKINEMGAKEIDDSVVDVAGNAERRVSNSEMISETFPIPPLSSLNENEPDHTSNKSSHHTHTYRRTSRNGSGSSKRKPSDGADSMSSASTLVRESLILKKRLKIGQNVLIPAKSTFMDSDRRISIDETHRDSVYVNAKGFPPGQGMTVAERHGPYIFVLAEIVKLHFENYFVNYSVKRHDTHRVEKIDRGE